LEKVSLWEKKCTTRIIALHIKKKTPTMKQAATFMHQKSSPAMSLREDDVNLY